MDGVKRWFSLFPKLLSPAQRKYFPPSFLSLLRNTKRHGFLPFSVWRMKHFLFPRCRSTVPSDVTIGTRSLFAPFFSLLLHGTDVEPSGRRKGGVYVFSHQRVKGEIPLAVFFSRENPSSRGIPTEEERLRREPRKSGEEEGWWRPP